MVATHGVESDSHGKKGRLGGGITGRGSGEGAVAAGGVEASGRSAEGFEEGDLEGERFADGGGEIAAEFVDGAETLVEVCGGEAGGDFLHGGGEAREVDGGEALATAEEFTEPCVENGEEGIPLFLVGGFGEVVVVVLAVAEPDAVGGFAVGIDFFAEGVLVALFDFRADLGEDGLEVGEEAHGAEPVGFFLGGEVGGHELDP